MHIIDSHFHWWPRRILENLSKSESYPRAYFNDRGGYTYVGTNNRSGTIASWAAWYDLEKEFEHMDGLGHDVDVVGSIGPLSVYFSELPAEAGRDAAMEWNEEMAGAQRKYPGRFWGTAAIPLVDARTAIEVLDHAVNELGLIGANLPGSVGTDSRIDAERLGPFYDRVEELGIPLLLHPTDAIFADILDGYNEALHLSLGRVVEVSSAAMRLVLSGIMERHPDLKLVMSHTGGALPYQAGRMDKNCKKAGLPRLPSVYLRRMFTDTVSPHALGIKFAIDFYGIDHVMYGTDYPCWDPATCLKLIDAINLGEADKQKLFVENARRIMQIPIEEPATEQPASKKRAAMPVP
jgi:aminocarboxymuconate-semialdehyde decarboxylase